MCVYVCVYIYIYVSIVYYLCYIDMYTVTSLGSAPGRARSPGGSACFSRSIILDSYIAV